MPNWCWNSLNVSGDEIQLQEFVEKSLTKYETSLTATSDSIMYSQSFFSRVLNRIQGSHLPFIFQANDTDPNYNPDQWAICRLDQKNVSITQAAPELYSLSMKLRESY